MAQTSLIYIGIAGTVLALDRATGREIWRTDLKGDFVNVVLQDGDLYAAAKGELFSLDPATGNVRWQNKLKGLGRGLMTIAGSNQTVVLSEKKRRDQANEAAAATAASS